MQTTETGISSATVANLQLRWTYQAGESIVSSPVVADNTVFVATGAGTVIALDQRTGTPTWFHNIGGPITMTPLVADGLVFVGTHTVNSDLYALDESTGTPRWHAKMRGYARGAPILVGGTMLIGQSGGDPPMCIQGGVLAYQATTGVLLWTWNTDPTPNEGGAVWSPISYGGNDIVFGTGNTCTASANANGLIRLTTDGKQEWQLPPQVSPTVDDDWGGSQLLYAGNIYSINKDGYFYGVNGSTGAIMFKLQLTTFDGAGSIGSPATNGMAFVVPTGFLKMDAGGYYSAAVLGVSLAGGLIWTVPTLDTVPGGAAITNDVAFVSIDYRLAALQVSTGKELWSFTPPGQIYASASPAVVSTGVYYANIGGEVMSFGLGNASATSGANESASSRLPPPSSLRQPYGPVIRRLSNGTYRAVY